MRFIPVDWYKLQSAVRQNGATNEIPDISRNVFSGGRRNSSPPAAVGAPAGNRATPARESWYAEPARVADNFYFIGTKIHSAWALVGSQGIIVIEALFDYAAKDEILGGLKKPGLDSNKVKYVILSHAHGDHDGGAKMLQDAIPSVHLVYGAEDWDAIDKAQIHMGGKPKHDVMSVEQRFRSMPALNTTTATSRLRRRWRGKSVLCRYRRRCALFRRVDACSTAAKLRATGK
jgi:hypothetical protein